MSLYTSSQFAAASATGTDWRDTSKAVLEKLEEVRTDGHQFNFGFLYITDHLADDAQSILNLFKSVLGIDHWSGCVGIAICTNGQAIIDEPAISAMIGTFNENDFCSFPSIINNVNGAKTTLSPWMKDHQPMLILTHGDPSGEYDIPSTVEDLYDFTNGFVIGGLSSSRKDHVQFSDTQQMGGFSGCAFSHEVTVASTLSQGCTHIGEEHTVTKTEDGLILEIDGKRATEVFENDLRLMAIKKIDRDPNDILLDSDDIPDEFKSLFQGEVHAAIPVQGSDQRDYMVRQINHFDQDTGAIGITEHLQNGSRLLFVKRDSETVQADLSRSLIALRERIIQQEGIFEPKGALYISCIARISERLENKEKCEVKLIEEIIGDVPLTGFYASGEINNSRLYSFTGILILFL